MLEGDRVDLLLTRAVDLLDSLREHVSRIGAGEHAHAARGLFEQIDATRAAAWRARGRPAR